MLARTLGDLSLLSSGGSWKLVNENATKIHRGWGQLLSFCNGSKLVMLGGFDSAGVCLSDVHLSTDCGVSWTPVCQNAPWLSRSVFAACLSECGSFMYVAGGICPLKGGFCNDVWLSRDGGASWTLQADRAPWNVRSGFGIALNPSNSLDISIFGGSSVDFKCLDDTWRSLDAGQTWEKVSTGPWKQRVDFACLQTSFGRILIAGGDCWSGNFYNDLWGTDDRGITWFSVNTDCEWFPRAGLAMVAITDMEFLVYGGNITGLKPRKVNVKSYEQENTLQRAEDVWKTFDGGKSWIKLVTSTTLGSRTMSRIVKGCGQDVILFGGWRQSGFSSDIWKTQHQESLENEEKQWLNIALGPEGVGLVNDVLNSYIFPYLYGK